MGMELERRPGTLFVIRNSGSVFSSILGQIRVFPPLQSTSCAPRPRESYKVEDRDG